MIVMKFGGTSVGSPERMKHVASLITNSGKPVFVVLGNEYDGSVSAELQGLAGEIDQMIQQLKQDRYIDITGMDL